MGQIKQVSGKQDIKRWFRWWMIPVGISILIWTLFHIVLMAGYVPSESMEPALKKGSYLIALRIYPSLETGDIIIFRRDGRLLVKRIAAVGGDTIDLGELTYAPGWMIPKRDKDVVVVPEGCFFVMGDNAENSFDSRYWEDMFEKEADVVARVWE